VLATVATWLVHRASLRYGFDYDDYHFLRPYAMREVLATFRGPWDLTGIEVKFYRPLTVILYATRFELFGLNATAHHAVSLSLFALAASLTGWLVCRLTERAIAAATAVLFVVCHPAMPYSLVTWITNQMHLALTITVLAALLWWHAVRTRSLIWWVPLLAFGTVAFMIKEDGVMLLPAIFTLHAITRRVAEPDLRPVPWILVGLSALLVVAMLEWRSSALGDLGGYGRPTAHAAWVNLTQGLNGVFRLVPAHRPWQPVASWFATLLPLVAFAAWRWISPGARVCLLAGATIAVLFNLPFMFVTKAEQMYLVGVGASITLAGAFVGLMDLAARARARRTCSVVVAGVLAAGLAAFVAVTRDISHDFEPFGPIVLSHDDIVRTWGPVPPELRDYLALKREPGAAGRVSPNPLDELSEVTFGVYGRETSPQGVRYMWMNSARAEIQVRASARMVTIPLRHPIEAFREPTRAHIEVDGRRADDLALTTPEWRMSTLPLRPSDVPRLSGMHRVRISIDHAWRPSEIIPQSTDERMLALQIGELAIR
jgi:Dolichyl-phosphate-mannose-protein mannosyltransferase